jgi:protein SCO1
MQSARLLLTLAALLLGVTACLAPTPQPAPLPRQTEPTFNGAVLSAPIQLPEFTLQRFDGTRFTSADLRGRVAMVFFGYTTCPDVCPLTMAHLAQARKQLGAEAQQVDAYFVTVDPERDSPQRLREYLGKFDPAIVGLTGTDAELERARQIFGVVAQRRDVPGSAVAYFMDHSAGLYLIDPASRLRVVEPYGLTPAEIAADVRRLLTENASASSAPEPASAVRPAEQPVATPMQHGSDMQPVGPVAPPAQQPVAKPAPQLLVEQPWARAADQGSTSAVYLTIRNSGPADTLLGAESEAAEAVELHRNVNDRGVMRMEPSGPLPIASGGTLRLEQGGLHIMLVGLHQRLAPGTTLRLVLRFERSGQVTIDAPVRTAAGMSGH